MAELFDVEAYLKAGNCSVCVNAVEQQFYMWQEFNRVFPTQDTGTAEERQAWLDDEAGDPEDGWTCPNCGQQC